MKGENVDEQTKLEIGDATKGEKEAYDNMRMAQRLLRDAPIGEDRELLRASVEHWTGQWHYWLQAKYTACLHHRRRMYG